MRILGEIRRFAKIGFRHRWLALALAWLICLPGWAGVYMLPNQYDSSARLYADADAVLGALLRGLAIDSSPATQVDLLQRTLLSRPNLEKIVARTDLDMRVDSVTAREGLLAGLAKSIKIGAQTRNLFTISFTDTDPQLARAVVQAVVNLFIEQATVTDRQQMENARTFVNQQIAAYETQLREAEKRRAEFRSRYLDLLPEGPGGLTGAEAARARVQKLRGELEDARQRRVLIRQQLDATPPLLSAADLAGIGGETRLAEAERTLRELRLRLTDQHPDVIAARNTIAELRNSGGATPAASRGPATARPAAIANPLHEQLKIRAVDIDAQIGSLERQAREAQADTERLETLARGAPQVQAQFLNLDRDYSVLNKNYEELLARRESLQIAGAARTGADRVRIEVVDPPTLPNAPTGPKRVLLSLGVLAAGLGAGAALAFLLVTLDRGFFTVRDLQALGLPVLGAVSPAQPAPRRTSAMVVFAGALSMLLLTCGAVLAGGPALVERVPALVARLMA